MLYIPHTSVFPSHILHVGDQNPNVSGARQSKVTSGQNISN